MYLGANPAVSDDMIDLSTAKVSPTITDPVGTYTKAIVAKDGATAFNAWQNIPILSKIALQIQGKDPATLSLPLISQFTINPVGASNNLVQAAADTATQTTQNVAADVSSTLLKSKWVWIGAAAVALLVLGPPLLNAMSRRDASA